MRKIEGERHQICHYQHCDPDEWIFSPHLLPPLFKTLQNPTEKKLGVKPDNKPGHLVFLKGVRKNTHHTESWQFSHVGMKELLISLYQQPHCRQLHRFILCNSQVLLLSEEEG